MKNLIIPILILAFFPLKGENFRVSVDGTTVKTSSEDITAVVKGNSRCLPKRYGKKSSLELKDGASLTLGKTSLLNGEYGTVEIRFSPRNFRMSTSKSLHLELSPVRGCFIRGVLANDVWNFFINYKGVTERHWIPVYSWHNDGVDITKLQKILTVSVGFRGVSIYLDGQRAQSIKYFGDKKVKFSHTAFLLSSAAPFEFISLYAADTVFSKDQALDRYVSLQSKKKMIDRPFLRIPRSRKHMSRRALPKVSDYHDATALCGMNDVVTNCFIQRDLQYYLKYDDKHFYIFSVAPVAKKRSLGFFAMLKYTETFDSENFTLNPWKSLAVAGAASSKWFSRTTVNKGLRLSEAWVESFASFGVDMPHPGVKWDVNFSCRSSEKDYGAWYQSDVKGIKSYGLIEFGGNDDLFSRMLVPPVFAGNTLKVKAVCVNPSARIRKFDFTCELFQPDGEIITLKSFTGKVPAVSRSSKTLLLDSGAYNTMLLKVILRDDYDKIFYLRTFVLKKEFK
jgi:hypothetical protein